MENLYENQEERFTSTKGELKFSSENNDQNMSFNEFLSKRSFDDIKNALDKYMPIGSVVKINNHKELIMIIGFNDSNNDYIGCLYPYGLSRTNNMIWFNHNNIESVYHVGYLDSKGKLFKQSLNKDDDSRVKL